jgi:hypothetical protein
MVTTISPHAVHGDHSDTRGLCGRGKRAELDTHAVLPQTWHDADIGTRAREGVRARGGPPCWDGPRREHQWHLCTYIAKGNVALIRIPLSG